MTGLSPGSFIPAAERYNLMPAIDRCYFTTRSNFCIRATSGTTRWALIL